MTNRKTQVQDNPFFGAVRRIINIFALLAGLSIFVMIGVTVIDVILRIFKTGIIGAYDIIRVAGVMAIACALPYVTAVKGHTAIEFFYQKFGRLGRIILDSIFRTITLGLFGFLSYQNIMHGISLLSSREVMPTLKIPIFWIPWLISFVCILMVIIIFYHLLHPGKEFVKP